MCLLILIFVATFFKQLRTPHDADKITYSFVDSRGDKTTFLTHQGKLLCCLSLVVSLLCSLRGCGVCNVV